MWEVADPTTQRVEPVVPFLPSIVAWLWVGVVCSGEMINDEDRLTHQ